MMVASTAPNIPPPPLGLKRHRQVLAWVRLASVLLVCLVSGLACAFDFPPLTGRVVDQAGVIPASAREGLETKLKDLEDKSGIQLVVATVKSLQGGDVETYAKELFRAWKLGEAKKNNGVLLLVAPAEHKVRIEVGYGLEGTLTDALAQVIIASAMVPRFKANDYPGGDRARGGWDHFSADDRRRRMARQDARAFRGPTEPVRRCSSLFCCFWWSFSSSVTWLATLAAHPAPWVEVVGEPSSFHTAGQAGVADRRGADLPAAASRAGAARRAAAAHRGVGDADHRE